MPSLFSQCGSICLALHYFMEKQMLSSSALADFHPVRYPPPGHISLCIFIFTRVINARLHVLANVNRKRCAAVFPVAFFFPYLRQENKGG